MDIPTNSGSNDLHKELDLIQSVISRMAHNSFLIKGWAMTLMSALIAFGKDLILAENAGVYYLVLMIGILIPFWWLDAYFLKQERAFRCLYKDAISDPKAESRTMFNLNPGEHMRNIKSVWLIMWRDAILWFYLPFILMILLGIILKATGTMNNLNAG